MKPFGSGEVKVGFVDRCHFDDGREFTEDFSDTIAPLSVELMVAIEKYGLWAEFRGSA